MSLNLVNYSDSSSEEEEEVKQQTAKKATKSKLPNPFEKPNEINTEIDDDSQEHDGRSRNFPHERGNWATYVYIQCPSTDFITELQNELINIIKNTNILEPIQFHAIDDCHISLTRTVVLRHHWIDEFVRSIEISLKTAHKFWIHLNSIRIYCNDNKTRTFISLSLSEMSSETKENLQYIVQRLDNCLADFKLDPFYKEASFHVSILWCLGDKREELTSLLPNFCQTLERLSSADDSSLLINVERLHCKIGNKLYQFAL